MIEAWWAQNSVSAAEASVAARDIRRWSDFSELAYTVALVWPLDRWTRWHLRSRPTCRIPERLGHLRKQAEEAADWQ